MVRIRLARGGHKRRPFYHIVVTDKENPRDGKFLERLGTYDPAKPDEEAVVDMLRWSYWTKRGAKPSERVAGIIKRYRKAKPEGEATEATPQAAS